MSKKYPWLTRNNIVAFVICLVIAAGLWLLIELQEQFTTQASFRIRLVDAPTERLITLNEEQTVKFSLQANGFKTLGCRLLRDSKRGVAVSLAEVPYRVESGNTYSFSSQYVAEQIAALLGVNASDLTMNDDKVYFDMELLRSKVVPVVLRADIRTPSRYETYGLPIIEPAKVTVYGPKDMLDTLTAVRTQRFAKSGVNESLEEMVPLDLAEGRLHCDVSEVKVNVTVLQYTEQALEVPVSAPAGMKMRLFPETVKVKFIVAMKDYPDMKPELFSVVVDPAQVSEGNTLLDLSIGKQPNNVEVLGIEPQRIEYLIVE